MARVRVIVAIAVCLASAAACSGTGSPVPYQAEPSRGGAATLPAVDLGAEEPTAPSPAPATPSATPTETGRPDPAKRRFSLLVTGDVLLHDGLWATARADGGGALDFRPMLAPMRPAVRSADLAVCHLETPVARPEGPFRGYPRFKVPPQVAPALRWAGYDACTTASNHSVDRGFAGLTRTLRVLDDAGLAHTGSYATRAASIRPLVLEVGGVRVGLVAATYGLNGLPLPAGAPWAVDLLDVDRVLARARAARQAGAEVVLVALHWGTDGYPEVTEEQRVAARRLARSGVVDLVYGHHAHVVQPFDRVAGTWVLYGLGNAIAQQDPLRPELWEGVAARVGFVERAGGGFRVARVRALPTLMTPYAGPMRYLDVDRALRSPAWAHLRPRLRAARQAVLTRVRALGERVG